MSESRVAGPEVKQDRASILETAGESNFPVCFFFWSCLFTCRPRIVLLLIATLRNVSCDFDSHVFIYYYAIYGTLGPYLNRTIFLLLRCRCLASYVNLIIYFVSYSACVGPPPPFGVPSHLLFQVVFAVSCVIVSGLH